MHAVSDPGELPMVAQVNADIEALLVHPAYQVLYSGKEGRLAALAQVTCCCPMSVLSRTKACSNVAVTGNLHQACTGPFV